MKPPCGRLRFVPIIRVGIRLRNELQVASSQSAALFLNFCWTSRDRYGGQEFALRCDRINRRGLPDGISRRGGAIHRLVSLLPWRANRSDRPQSARNREKSLSPHCFAVLPGLHCVAVPLLRGHVRAVRFISGPSTRAIISAPTSQEVLPCHASPTRRRFVVEALLALPLAGLGSAGQLVCAAACFRGGRCGLDSRRWKSAAC